MPPGGEFPLPSPSFNSLAFRCAPAIWPYLAEDVSSPAAILIDSPVVFNQIANAELNQLSNHEFMLDVTAGLDGRTLAIGSVPLNTTAYELPFRLEGIEL